VVRKTHIPEGGIKRLSVSVLLDQRVRREGNGPKLVAIPTPPETIKAVHDLVAGVTGFIAERGDQIVIESLPFNATLARVEASDPGPSAPSTAHPSGKPKTQQTNWKDPKMLMWASSGALLLLLLGGAWMFLRKRRSRSSHSNPATAKAVEGANRSTAELAGIDPNSELARRLAEQEKADLAEIASLKASSITTRKGDLLTKEIGEVIKKDPGVSAHVLHTWLHEDD
jgi:flagellar M-ring protein FliF